MSQNVGSHKVLINRTGEEAVSVSAALLWGLSGSLPSHSGASTDFLNRRCRLHLDPAIFTGLLSCGHTVGW